MEALVTVRHRSGDLRQVGGGVVQVVPGSSKQPLVASLQTVRKNGYLYVYVSNESPQDVFFDDVTVKHYTGALVQEQSYYPFGLQMAAISDKALKKDGTPYKYNAGSELEDELEYYNTFYRKYDAQIGRFTGIDILSESTSGLSPFHYGNNNPVMFNDPSGAKSARVNGRMEKGADGNYHVAWLMEMGMGGGTGSSNDYGETDAGGGGGGGGLASRVNGGFMFRGAMAQNFFRDMMDVYYGITDKITVGANKNGDVGYWHTVVTIEANSGITGNPLVTQEFESGGDFETEVRNLISKGDYLGATKFIISSYPAIGGGLTADRDYTVGIIPGLQHNTWPTGQFFNGKRINNPLIGISKDPFLKYMAGHQSYGNLVRGIYHEFIHDRLLLGIFGNFGTLNNRTAPYTAVHETIARFFVLTNGSLPMMCHGSEISSTARSGIEYYNSINNSNWSSQLSYMCDLFNNLINEK